MRCPKQACVMLAWGSEVGLLASPFEEKSPALPHTAHVSRIPKGFSSFLIIALQNVTWKERKGCENISPVWTDSSIRGDTSSPTIRAPSLLPSHATKASSVWNTTQHHGEGKKISSNCPSSESWQESAVLCVWGCSRRTSAQNTSEYKNTSQSTSRSDALPCPAVMAAHGTHPRRAGECIPFRRQASWDRLSLPVASHALILAWRVSAFGVRTNQECSPCPRRAQFPCGQGSSIPTL